MFKAAKRWWIRQCIDWEIRRLIEADNEKQTIRINRSIHSLMSKLENLK